MLFKILSNVNNSINLIELTCKIQHYYWLNTNINKIILNKKNHIEKQMI